MSTPSRDPLQPDDAHNGTPAPAAHVFRSSISKSRTMFHRDLERMGDYAAGIARICVQIGDSRSSNR
jgi:phosphate uptake regulator